MLTHAEPHCVVPVWQTHADPLHTCRAPQVVPQLPQLFGSLVGSMQVPLHESSLPGQPHRLLTQSSPALQTFPHVPQLFGSVEPSTQLCPQVSNGELQMGEHVPPEQTSLALQTLPQVPQFRGSLSGSMHAVPHWSVPLPQLHCAPTQVAPSAQVLPHAPQLPESELRSTHWPLQKVNPDGQMQRLFSQL